MSEQGDISVVVTTYQSAKDIQAALDSVLSQSVQPREIIVVDDGSTDDTVERAACDPLVITIALPHSGSVARSRNVGLERSCGAWVAFLDADDRWLPGHIETSLRILRDPNVAMVCGNALRNRDAESIPFFAHLDSSSVFRDATDRTVSVTTRDLLRVRPVIMSSVVARRASLNSIGGFDERVEVVASEDFAAWLKLSTAGASIVYHSSYHVAYTEGPQSLTRGEREELGRWATLRVLGEAYQSASDRRLRQELRIEIARDRFALAASRARRGRWTSAARAAFEAPPRSTR